MSQKLISQIKNKYLKRQTLIDDKIFTPQQQRLLKNIYQILTGRDSPEEER